MAKTTKRSGPALSADDMAQRARESGNDRRLFMVGNAHIDPVWQWHWTEGYQEARATLWSAITLMGENPDYVFTMDQVALLEWIEEADPELFAAVVEAEARGQLEFVGGWWVEPDCNLPSGESFVRQGLYSQRFLRDRFGRMATVGCNVDPFGHNVMLPQILHLQRMSAYCFLRPGPHELTLPASAFQWESPDGTRIIAYRLPHEYCSPGGDLAYHVEKSINQLSADTGDAMVFYGVGNHGGGPTRRNLESIATLDQRGTFGRLELSSPSRFFAHLRETAPELPVWSRDLQHHAPGCYSANSAVKATNRRVENLLGEAESFAVLGRDLAGTGYPLDALTRAWKSLLFNQFHDILPGSAIEATVVDTRDQTGESAAIAGRAINLALQTIARRVDIPFEDGTQPVLVFNSLPWPVRSPVEIETLTSGGGEHLVDDAGEPVPSQRITPHATTDDGPGQPGRRRVVFEADLPAHGYRMYRLRPGGRSAVGPDIAGPLRLENEILRVDLDADTGWIARILDARSGTVHALDRSPHTVLSEDASDTWGHRVISYVADGEPFRPVSISIAENGPLRGAIRVVSAAGSSRLSETFRLDAGSGRVHVRVHLDWRERCRLLKLRIPTAVQHPEVTYESQFGAVTRGNDGRENPGQSWVDVSGTIDGRAAGLAVVNTAKYAYDVTDGSIGITAARSPVFSWHDPRQLGELDAFSFQDQGIQSFDYALIPHDGSWRDAGLPRATAEIHRPPRAMFESFHAGDLASSASSIATEGDSPLVVTTIKAAEDDPADTILRLADPLGRGGDIRLRVGEREVHATLRPSEIRTLRVPVAPDADVAVVDLLEFPIDAVASE